MTRTPWWQWPNILSLDAPVIAVVWQEAFARAFAFPVSVSERAVLFLVVWVIYAADHVTDGIRLGAPADAAARHRFASRHRRGLSVLVLVAGLGVLILASFLPLRLMAGGAALGGIVAVYFLWNHLAGERLARRWAKEAVVGGVFALGCALVPLLGSPRPVHFLPVAVFALVCLANCLLISRVERQRDILRGETSLAVGLSPQTRPARAIALLAGGLALPLAGLWPALSAALMVSAAGIWCGLLVERRWGAEPAVVWADFVLLSPLLFWVV
jgi:hypothetical protein